MNFNIFRADGNTDELLVGFTMSLDGVVLLGSEVDRLNGGLTSSVDGDESEAPADPSAPALPRNGTGLGTLIFWSVAPALILIISEERTWTETGRCCCWPAILPATVKRAASGSWTLFFHPFWAVSRTLSRSAMLLLLLVVGMSPSELVAASSTSVVADGLDGLPGTGLEILLRHSVSPLFCRAANLCKIKIKLTIKNEIHFIPPCWKKGLAAFRIVPNIFKKQFNVSVGFLFNSVRHASKHTTQFSSLSGHKRKKSFKNYIS
jgi:hypothetical protein